MDFLRLLVDKGLLREPDLGAVRHAQAASPGRPPHAILLDRNLVREEDLLPVLAEYFGMDLVDLTKTTIDPETLRSFPAKLVHRRSVLPLARDNGTLVVATGDPFDVYALDELQTH